MCCDTTSSNTGWKNGTCVILEKDMKKQLLLLPCRHHILEVVLSSVFELISGKTSGPNVEQFKQFNEKWNDIDENSELQGIPQSYFNTFLTQELKTDTIKCLQKILSSPGYALQVLGGLHNARWMCTILFCSLVCVKQWLQCPSLRDAAFNDIQFCKNLHSYQSINEKVAVCAMTTFKGHLSGSKWR